MSDWAVFNDEGMLQSYGDRARAEAAAEREKVEDKHAYAGPICPDHEDKCAWHCELCNAEEEEEEESED